MSSSQLSPKFVVFVVVSLITHLLELAASGLFCHTLIQQASLKTPWFSVSAGLLIIPLVAVQLASAVFLLRRKGESSTTCEVTATAVLHVLQLGFISRHFAILQESQMTSKKSEVVEMLMLRISFAFTSGCTLFLLQLYLLFQNAHESSWIWAVYVSGVTTLVSITWALSTFRRYIPEVELDSVLIAWPGTVLKMMWRAGEILTRVIALALFASLYRHWVILVIGLHWLAMLVCVCVPVMTSLNWRTTGNVRRAILCIMTSFAYVFAFINTSAENAVFRYTFYYVVIFLENSTLIAVWLIQCSSSEYSLNSTFVFIAAISFVVSIIAMIIYYKFFHVASIKNSPVRTCGGASCVNCKLGANSSHPPIPPRPGAAGSWLNQYQSAVYCGQYYKHNIQDSLLDSVSDRNSTVTVSSSHARLQQKLATIDDEVKEHDANCGNRTQQCRNEPCSSSLSNVEDKSSSRGKSRKKTSKKSKGRTATSESEISSARTEAEYSEDSGSQKRPVWLPSGDSNFANQLLTYSLETFDTADTADDERSSVATGCHGYHSGATSPRELVSGQKCHHKNVPFSGVPLQRSGDHHWYSDGYSTDRTLDWPKMPVTSIQRNMWPGSNDNDSECCHCCECSHGDSEVSSILRSITTVPESDVEAKSSHCHHHDYHHRQHGHKATHHHSRHVSPRNEDSSGVPKKHRHDKLSARDLESIQDSRTRTKRDKIHRNEVLSSPASDPSYGPKVKRKHSPKRRLNASPRQDNTTSFYKSNEHQSIGKKLPQTKMCSNVIDNDRTLAESDKLASELIKSSSSAEQHKSKNRVQGTSSSTSDPRFSVRVMTSSADETSVSPNDPGTDKIHSKVETDTEDSKSDKIIKLVSKISDVDIDHKVSPRECPTDTYFISPTVTGSEKAKEVTPPTAGSDKDEHEGHSDNPHSSSTSDNTDNQGEVIYENIWQVNKSKLLKHKKGVDNKAFVSDPDSRRASRFSSSARDAWYVCSESEDSALPPEALSSSVDGFTASDDSDVSMEIVI